MSSTVSRVLYQTIIYLGPLLPAGSSNLPGTRRAAVSFLFGLASDGVYTAIPVTRDAVSFYLAFSPLPPCPVMAGRRLFSVALAWESPPPDVIRHPALRSPDFPHLRPFGACSCDRPCCSSVRILSLAKKFVKFFIIPQSAPRSNSHAPSAVLPWRNSRCPHGRARALPGNRR